MCVTKKPNRHPFYDVNGVRVVACYTKNANSILVSIVPHEVGQLRGRALGGIHVNLGGLKGSGAWGYTSRGVRDGMGPILPRGRRRRTNVGGRPRVGVLGDKPRGALAAGAGWPGVAGVAQG